MRSFSPLLFALLLVACGGADESSETVESGDTSGDETADEETVDSTGGAAPAMQTCTLRDGAVDLAIPVPDPMQLILGDGGCFVLEGDVPGTSPAVVMISAIPVSTHSINSDRLASEPDGARQYYTQGSMLGDPESIEARGEESIELLMQGTQAYRLFASAPEGTDGPRDVTVARVITDEQMIISVMAVTSPDDTERRERLMSILTGMIIAP